MHSDQLPDMIANRLRSLSSASTGHAQAPRRQARWLRWAGIGLIAFSFLLYGGLLLIPALALTLEAKVGVSTGLVVAGEVTYWVGVVIVGREIVARYRDRLQPRRWLSWLRDRRPSP